MSRAFEIRSPGQIEMALRQIPSPAPGEVLLVVEACGLCGADLSDIDRGPQGRVPGHEVVGRIAALGPGVAPRWKLGQRVGVGRLGGPCLACDFCARGRFALCRDQPVTGSSRDGGYADHMLARETGLIAIPPDLAPEAAAPILCAGLATFNALRVCGATAGDTVAVFGLGGLGHMAVQYAARMGFRTLVIGRGVREDAKALGAHDYLEVEGAAEALAARGGAQAILATPAHAAPTAALLPGLAPGGTLVLLGVGRDPLAISMGAMVGGERRVLGSLTGSGHDAERALDFSILTGARPWIRTLPLSRAPEAVALLRAGKPRYRIVLTMETA